jgi:predicted rRNA methylase YqxC with S4 and FtsJ domains
LGLLHPLRFTVQGKGSFIADNYMDVWTLKEVLLDDCYQINSLSKCSLIIDIGASIGDFTILASSKAKHVISCEVDLHRLHLLRANIQLAKKENITIIPKKIINLDSLFSKKMLSCDLLKIDCEGSEYPILLNAKMSTLRKIKKMIGELHFFNQEMKYDFKRLKKRLASAGFIVKIWENPVHDSICFFSASRR